jgi:shikimate dehydrogenase
MGRSACPGAKIKIKGRVCCWLFAVMTTISGKTQLIGLLGWPVAHSLSPAMHNAAAMAAGLDLVYVPLPVRPEDVATAVEALRTFHFLGANVTVPHKQAVIPFLADLDAAAKAIGAVNTIVSGQVSTRDRQPSAGYNTDCSGFLADLAELGVAVAGRDCLVLGAGGSARAVVYGLAQAGARVQVLARRSEQAQELVEALTPHVAGTSGWLNSWPLRELATAVSHTVAPLIVNTTPLGMSPQSNRSPWPADLPFPPGAFLYDLVYKPATTHLMRQAMAAGVPVANGLGMLLWQGVQAFQLWTGQMPEMAVMRRALLGG